MRDDLIRMANQIARQFEHLSTVEASVAVADHLTAFWSPAMRQELLACQEADPASLRPVVVNAANLLRQRLVAAGAA
jgi:formate dehydrogenase subunit delta